MRNDQIFGLAVGDRERDDAWAAATTPLRALLVEDSEDDAELVLRELRRAKYAVQWQRVDTEEAMRAALDQGGWDVILSDYHMPRFDALAALAVVKQRRGLDIPFIIVSGTVGEELAVAAMRVGAHDYLLKGALTRLPAAVERELREASHRAERRKMQEHLLISDRMASVGTLAAGVAHEINNPLAAVLANLDFALEVLGKAAPDRQREEVQGPLREAREAADRVRLIVRDLKIFSRAGDDEQNGAVDLERVLESSLRMAWNEIRHRARLRKEYGAAPAAQGNESRLGQVFLNLIVNAAQAIPEGRSEDNEIRVAIRQEGDQVVVEIGDTGTGIPPHVLPRIFDPFFTTKSAGVGTGLGLAICHRIVTGLGGAIAVDSRPGRGTVFRVALPRARGEADGRRSDLRQRLPAAPRRPACILVVDDEALINKVVCRMLADHRVVAVSSVREALQAIDGGEGFDLVLCDLMMPEMTGMDLHRELVRARPALADRVVFMTGGAFTPAAREYLDAVPNIRLEKPFDARGLRQAVDRILLLEPADLSPTRH
jgi:signal transduction histidine kinase